MKNLKKIVAIALTAMMLLSISAVSFADTELVDYTAWVAKDDMFTTTDDFNNFSMINKILCHLWGDTLVEYDYDKGEYFNALATDIHWSEDYLDCYFTIREGVYFSNGAEVTAEDVAFSYQRIVRDADKLANTMVWFKLLGAEATDKYSGVIHFSQMMPNFNSEAYWVPIICKEAHEADPDGFWNAPIGSGPYKWIETDFTANTGRLEFWNAEWWGYEAFGKEPSNIKYVGIKDIDEETTRVSSVRTGEISVGMAIPYDSIATLESDGINVLKNDSGSNVYLLLNCHEGSPFADPDVRKALSLAIDRDLIMDAIIGFGKVSTFPVPDYIGGYEEGHSYEYNPELAKEILAASSYNGEEIKLDNGGVIAQGDEVAQAIQFMLNEVGFNITINIMETAAYNAAGFGGDYAMQLRSFSMNNGEAFKVMDEIIGPTDVFQSGLVNEEAFAIIEVAENTMDLAERNDLEKQAFALIFDNYGPNVYLYDTSYAIGVVPQISGVVLHNDTTMELRFMTIAQ